MTSKPTVLVFDVSPRTGTFIANKFAGAGYQVAATGRSVEDDPKDLLLLLAFQEQEKSSSSASATAPSSPRPLRRSVEPSQSQIDQEHGQGGTSHGALEELGRI